jgi:hypothetical protein
MYVIFLRNIGEQTRRHRIRKEVFREEVRIKSLLRRKDYNGLAV